MNEYDQNFIVPKMENNNAILEPPAPPEAPAPVAQRVQQVQQPEPIQQQTQTVVQTNTQPPAQNNTQVANPSEQSKPVPNIDLGSEIYTRNTTTRKNGGGKTVLLLAVLVICAIVFWPKINTALQSIGLIKQNNNEIIDPNKNETPNQETPVVNNNQTQQPEEQNPTPEQTPEEQPHPNPEQPQPQPQPTPTPTPKPDPTPAPTPTPKPDENKVVSWNGVYKNGDSTIKIYQTSSKEIAFTGTRKTSYLGGTADINGNVAEGKIFETYTLTISGNTLIFATTDTEPSIAIGTYTKVSDYTKTDYYEDTFGDSSYLTSEINGIFVGEKFTIKIFQTDYNEGRIHIKYNDYSFMSYMKDFDIVNNTIHLEDDFFDEIETIDGTISGNTLTITASHSDPDDMLNEISGTYTKTGSYTLDEIMKDSNMF